MSFRSVVSEEKKSWSRALWFRFIIPASLWAQAEDPSFWESACLCLSFPSRSWVIVDIKQTSNLAFIWIPGIQTQAPMLCDKCFYPQNHCPASMLFFYIKSNNHVSRCGVVSVVLLIYISQMIKVLNISLGPEGKSCLWYLVHLQVSFPS